MTYDKYNRWRAFSLSYRLAPYNRVNKINGFRTFWNVAPIAAANRRREKMDYSPAWGKQRAIRERMGREINLPVRYWGDVWQKYRHEDLRARLSCLP